MSISARASVNSSADLTTIICGVCSGIYAIAERYRSLKQEKGEGWHCPYCQSAWGYFGTGDNARLKRELAEKDRQLQMERKRTQWAENKAAVKERQRRAAKGQLTKIKNRITNGVCPCCQRSFANLRRHMQYQHPGYQKNDND